MFKLAQNRILNPLASALKTPGQLVHSASFEPTLFNSKTSLPHTHHCCQPLYQAHAHARA